MPTRFLLTYGLTAWLLSLGILAPAWSVAATASPAQTSHATTRGLAHKVKKPAHKNVAQPQDGALVQNIRVKDYSDYTRLVLDLDQQTTFTQSRQESPNRAVVELQNTRLSERLRAKLSHKKLPGEVSIAQPHTHSVTVSVNLNQVRDYKLIALSRPERLVVDLYHQSEQGEPALAQSVEPPPPAPVVAKAAPSEPTPMSIAEPAPPVQLAKAQQVPETPPAPTPLPVRASQRSAPGKAIKLIVIDPGHGGKDPGAIGQQRTAEKDVTLQVGLKLRDLITKYLGVQVLMTRDRDVFVELGDRAKFANSKDADLFVSIHVNSHPQRNTKGLEVYHFGEASDRRALAVAARENGTPIESTGVGWQYILADFVTSKKIEKSQELAWTTKQAMVAHLDDHYDVVDHGVKTAPFYVIRFTTMPSILAEIAFISNPTEEKLMRTDMFTSRMADAIFQGIRDYVNPIQTAAR
ncbi:MAG: N-acetylmuramoyl-L-alanine amidase [Nitrospirota bacterium]|nr:N-acetylmuramoyl-L-alanine amidase [Nitrospirota bacterium]MDE3226367.1 N-acetylmuramoyl-L-alanine amidase [Nitrospirota bacterium]MDE3241522.1 N-acetylmuramoyl-L-alanine amidase [Nitrospirota bacterium]